MAPSRTLRTLAPILLVPILATPILTQGQQPGWRPLPSYSEQKERAPSPTRPTIPNPVATWKWNVEGIIGGYWVSSILIYQDGKMILLRDLPDGEVAVRELIERPTGDHCLRKFDIEDWAWSEYFTLSATGIVRQFEWYGTQFSRSRTTFLDADAMTVGRRSQPKICIRRELSRDATYFIRLYRELHVLRRDRQFARVGFAGGAGRTWMESFKALHGSAEGIPFFREMGFPVFDLWEIAMVYVDEAGGYVISRERWELAGEREQIIAPAIAQAQCKREE